MKKSILLPIVLILFSALTLRSQNMSDLLISEVMVDNESSVVNDYGEHTPWIEILNTSQGTVNFAGCYFTDDLSNLTKSPVMKGDNRTKLGPRQVTLFFADGDSSKGTFYLNFKLRKGSTLYLISNDGRTVIDSIEIPADLPAGQSISKFPLVQDDPRTPFEKIQAGHPSPGLFNGAHGQKSRAQEIKEKDPHGTTLSLVSVTVVFAALLILLTIYSISGNFFSGKYQKRKESRKAAVKAAVPKGGAVTPEVAAAIAMALRAGASDETYAAIAMALHLHLHANIHDAEPFFLTISPRESGWNQKQFNFRKR